MAVSTKDPPAAAAASTFASSTAPEWQLPQLQATLQLSKSSTPRSPKVTLFDVQFYPYAAPGVDPFFAVTGGRETTIFRPLRDAHRTVEVIRHFQDEDADASLNSCTWSKDPINGHPLICVTGARPRINVLDVVTGALVKTLIGHGGPINELVTSPISPQLIATGSEDGTVRVWSLDDQYQTQPGAVICTGEGYQAQLQTIAWHVSGRYLLAAGMDCTVNLWTIPELPNNRTGTDHPTVVHSPHFASSAIHSHYIDCVLFYGDLIFSKCAFEHQIVLWRIKGFDSTAPPPDPDDAPTPRLNEATRSAFGDGYERLLQFRTYDVDPFYIRFTLFVAHSKHPILAAGNNADHIFLWDLRQLMDWAPNADLPFPTAVRKGATRPLNDHDGSGPSRRGNSATSVASSGPTSSTLSRSGAQPGKAHDISDPFESIHPHSTTMLRRKGFVTRQIAFSTGGEWMVVVGELSTVAIFSRWQSDEEYVRHGGS
ncbi:MAG: hypothetical protein M1823_000012 [Watsoniomyces obsoletus]|nr:MAG: hypothetical protein M1823_000012 [Watsoniomyces obsoletus]